MIPKLEQRTPHERMREFDRVGKAYFIENVRSTTYNYGELERFDVLAHGPEWICVTNASSGVLWFNMAHVVSLKIVEVP
jgi:hypothetical protein